MRVVVLGCGRVGSGVARELDTRGCAVTVVDRDDAALGRLGEGFSGRRVHGSVLHEQVLQEVGIADADAAAVVTGDDATNVVLALVARRRFRVPVVVARLYDPRTAELAQRLGVRALAPVSWGIQRIADLVTSTPIAPAAILGAGGVEVLEVRVPPLLVGQTAAELQVPGEIDVIAVTRHGRTTLATAATRFEAGDLVHVAVDAASRARLGSLVGEP